MKKILVSLLGIMLITTSAYAFNPEESLEVSSVLTGDGQAVTGAGYLYGILCANDGANNWTLDLYDNTSAAGTKLVPSLIVTTAATERSSSIWFNQPVNFSVGVWFQTTTSDPDGCIVYYRFR